MKNNKNNIRVGLDIDGTIRDIYTPLVKILEEENPNMDFPPLSQWEHYEIWRNLNLKEEYVKDIWFNRMAVEIYYSNSLLYEPGFWASFDEKNYNFDIILISGQPNIFTMGYTLQWLEDEGILFKELHFTTEKHLVYCDYYIDDSPAYLEQLWQNQTGKRLNYGVVTPVCPVIKINRPWNKNCKYCDAQFDTVEEAFNYIKTKESHEQI